jgi:hypothetical protein
MLVLFAILTSLFAGLQKYQDLHLLQRTTPSLSFRALRFALVRAPLGISWFCVSPECGTFQEEHPRPAPKTYRVEHQKAIHVGECGGFVGVLSLNNPKIRTEKALFRPHSCSKQHDSGPKFAIFRPHSRPVPLPWFPLLALPFSPSSIYCTLPLANHLRGTTSINVTQLKPFPPSAVAVVGRPSSVVETLQLRNS